MPNRVSGYLSEALKFIKQFQDSNAVVFLDPDTGLEPKGHGLQHVLESEAKIIYDNLMKGDVFVFYQHQTNRNGRPWIEPKREQLARALNIDLNNLKIAYGQLIARDVAFYYCTKPNKSFERDWAKKRVQPLNSPLNL